MSPNNLISILESITLLSVVKLMILLLLLVYVIFAGLMMKQITAMTRAVSMKDDFVVRILGTIHFVLAALTIFLAFMLL